MSYKIQISTRFQKDVKKLIRKYPSFKDELISLRNSLIENPFQGTSIKYNCYKIRISILSKGKGKSGGARVITHIHVKDKIVYLLTIFDKSKMENITDKELEFLVKEII